MHPLSIAVLISVAFVIPSQALAQEHKINLNRPLKAGTYQYSATRTEVSEWTDRANFKDKDQNDLFTLEGVLTLTGKSDDGPYGKLSVGKCVFNKKPKLASGTVVEIQQKEGSYAFRANGKAAPKDTSEMIADLLPEEEGGVDSDGDLFDPVKTIKVGETWKIDSAKFARSQQEAGEVKESKVSGQGKLLRVLEFGGMQCLDVEVNVAFEVKMKSGRVLKVKQGYEWILPEESGPVLKGVSRFASSHDDGKAVNVLSINETIQLIPRAEPPK